MGVLDKWAVRVGARMYAGGDGDEIEIHVDRSEKGERMARLLVPRMIGLRLLAEDKAREAAAVAAAAAAMQAQAVAKDDEFPPTPALGVIVKSALRDNAPDFDKDEEDEGSGAPAPLPTGLLAQPGRVEVFSKGERDRLPQTLKGFENEKHDRLKHFAMAALRRDGVRDLDFDRDVVMEGLDALAHDFPNLADVIDFLRCELAIALAGDLDAFRVSPVLLVGEPGIGKTAFCRTLAGLLGVGFDDFSAGGGQGGFDLCGTSVHFGNCTPGRIFRLLAEGDSAAPVLLLDEVDKIGGDDRFPVLPTLLNLAEGDSARQFRDECLEVKFDASRVIIVMTANDLSTVPAPLLSRVQVIEVPHPTVGQRRAIAVRMLAALPPVTVPDAALDRLAESDADLREVQRRLRRAVGEALARGARDIEADAILEGQRKRRPAGFV